jgi:DNA-binding beta-propeller fold protein YncE
MPRTRLLAIFATALATMASVVVGRTAAQTGRTGGAAPAFDVDRLWPKPLPNHWVLGSVTGVAVDARDHIWLVHRGIDSMTTRTEVGLGTNPPTAETCCAPAPFVLEFDSAGALVSQWGGTAAGGSRAFDWPVSPGGIAVDAKGNVWIAAAGTEPSTGGGGAGRGGKGGAAAPAAPRPTDAHVLKFSSTGQFLLQIGKAGAPGDSNSTTGLNRPTGTDVDTAANEVYVADGMVNRRVVVFDATTGAYKRHWGAYGAKPDDAAMPNYDPNVAPAKQFRTVSCVRLAKDGTVYVCDRQNDRIQSFKKDGTFVKEGFVSKTTLAGGSVWDIAFSSDPQQQFLFVADAQDEQVWIVNRSTLEVVGKFGDGGRYPGQFRGVGSVAVDSKGVLYTGETFEGKRVQRFVKK